MENMSSVSSVVATDHLQTVSAQLTSYVLYQCGAVVVLWALKLLKPDPPSSSLQWQGLTGRGADGDDPGARASVQSITHYVTPIVAVLCVCSPGLVCPTDCRAWLLKQGLSMAADLKQININPALAWWKHLIENIITEKKHSTGLNTHNMQVHKYTMWLVVSQHQLPFV